MHQNAPRLLIVAVIVLFSASGCCTLSPRPCCDCYDQVKTTHFTLSSNVTTVLDTLNASLSNDPNVTDGIRLNVCNNIALAGNVVPEIAENIRQSCGSPGLSSEQRDDCQSAPCKDRLQAEWCNGLAAVIGKHLAECARNYRYDGRNCQFRAAEVQN